MMKKHTKKTPTESLHAFSGKFKKYAKKGTASFSVLMKEYLPKVKQQANILGDQVYNATLKYTPKVKSAFLEFTRTYGRKFQEAFIAFRRNYEPKIKQKASHLGSKTIDFAEQLKRKINKKL